MSKEFKIKRRSEREVSNFENDVFYIEGFECEASASRFFLLAENKWGKYSISIPHLSNVGTGIYGKYEELLPQVAIINAAMKYARITLRKEVINNDRGSN